MGLAYFFVSMFIICINGTFVRYDLREDGIPVLLLEPEEIHAELAIRSSDYPFKKFPAQYVKKALGGSIDWRKKGAVTTVKDQGPHGIVVHLEELPLQKVNLLFALLIISAISLLNN